MYTRRYRRRRSRYPSKTHYFDWEEPWFRPFHLVVIASGIALIAVAFLLWSRTGKPSENKQKVATNLQKTPSGYPPMAKVPSADLTLYLPGEVNKVVTIGYHEAENSTTYTMQPLGRCAGNENERGLDSAAPFGQGQLPFFVMNTRGRRASAISAVDVAAAPGTEIRSPVNGEITKVKSYYLYGKYADYHVEIMPEGHPEIRVAMIHLDNLQVKVGDRVEHGQTVLGSIRQFKRPIRSQIDRYTGTNFGHLHLQVNPFVEQEDGITGS